MYNELTPDTNNTVNNITNKLTTFLKSYKNTIHIQLAIIQSIFIDEQQVIQLLQRLQIINKNNNNNNNNNNSIHSMTTNNKQDFKEQTKQQYQQQYKQQQQQLIIINKDLYKIVQRFLMRINQFVQYRLIKTKSIPDQTICIQVDKFIRNYQNICASVSKQIQEDRSIRLTYIFREITRISDQYIIRCIKRVIGMGSLLTLTDSTMKEIDKLLNQKIQGRCRIQKKYNNNFYYNNNNHSNKQDTKDCSDNSSSYNPYNNRQPPPSIKYNYHHYSYENTNSLVKNRGRRATIQSYTNNISTNNNLSSIRQSQQINNNSNNINNHNKHSIFSGKYAQIERRRGQLNSRNRAPTQTSQTPINHSLIINKNNNNKLEKTKRQKSSIITINQIIYKNNNKNINNNSNNDNNDSKQQQQQQNAILQSYRKYNSNIYNTNNNSKSNKNMTVYLYEDIMDIQLQEKSKVNKINLIKTLNQLNRKNKMIITHYLRKISKKNNKNIKSQKNYKLMQYPSNPTLEQPSSAIIRSNYKNINYKKYNSAQDIGDEQYPRIIRDKQWKHKRTNTLDMQLSLTKKKSNTIASRREPMKLPMIRAVKDNQEINSVI